MYRFQYTVYHIICLQAREKRKYLKQKRNAKENKNENIYEQNQQPKESQQCANRNRQRRQNRFCAYESYAQSVVTESFQSSDLLAIAAARKNPSVNRT